MTNREKEIFELIKTEPSITQKEIAKRLNLTRTSVAVHITHIIEKGYILGRQYVIKKTPLILVIGGCNIDMQGFPDDTFKLYNSNVGKIMLSHGGVGRNIAVNSNKLVKNTKLISVLSSDNNGNDVLNSLIKQGINTDDILIVDEPMSMYSSIFDKNNEMIAAIADMRLVDKLTKDFLKTKEDTIKNSEYIVIDTNIPKESIEYIAEIKAEDAKIFIDTVSVEKATKILTILDKIDVLKTNKLELEAILDRRLKKISDVKAACKELLEKGVKKVFVTLGKDGLIYSDENKTVKLSNPKNVEVVDVNGAGDMFTSALIFAELHRLNIDKMAKFAQSASVFKIGRKGTTPSDFSIDCIKKVMDKHYPEISKGDFFYEI